MRGAILQYAPNFLAIDENLDRVDRMLRGISVDLLVLPELFASGYHFRTSADVERVAESLDDASAPTLNRLRQWSNVLDTTIVAGYPEVFGNACYNSAAVVSGGQVVGNYRKVHLFYREKHFFQPGDTFTVFDIPSNGVSYRLGVMICYDWYFPEAARTLALSGADVIAHPANLVRKDCPRSMPIRALENHVYTATANRTGSETADGETLTFIGQSRACDPMGDVLCELSRDDEGIATFEFDPTLSRERQINATNNLFGDRRPSVYGAITGTQ